MSKLDTFEYNLLRTVFNGTALTNFGATAGSTLLWAALHTADPGDSGSSAAEGGYTEYTRVSIERSTAGWAVTSGSSAAAASVSPVANIDFPQSLSTTTGNLSHFSINPSSNGAASSGCYNGTITPNINFGQNVTPRLTTASSITEQ